MNNVEVNFHGSAMGNRPTRRPGIEDDYRYHVWMTQEGEPGEHIYKNHVDPEQAKRSGPPGCSSPTRSTRSGSRKALGKLGVPLAVAMDEAERAYSRREERREADIQAGRGGSRADGLRGKALEAYPYVREAFDRMCQDDELLAGDAGRCGGTSDARHPLGHVVYTMFIGGSPWWVPAMHSYIDTMLP